MPQEIIKPDIALEREVIRQDTVPPGRDQEVFDSKIADVDAKLRDDKRDKQTAAQFKQTDKLIKAVADLDKRLKGDGKNPVDKAGNRTGIRGLLDSAKSGIGEKLGNTFSLKGVASMAGLGGMGGIGGWAMGAITDRDDAKKTKRAEGREQTENARQFAEGFAKYTDEGRELANKDPGKAMERGVEHYEKKRDTDRQIAEIEQKQKQAREIGGGADITEVDKAKLKQLQSFADTQFGGALRQWRAPVDKNPVKDDKKKEPGKKPVDPLAQVRAQVQKRGDPLEQELLAKFDKQQAEKAGSPTGVLAVNADNNPAKESDEIQLKQLAALETLVANSVISEEDRLERKKPETNTVAKEQKGKTEEKSGLLDGLLGGLLGGGVVPGLKKMFPLLARLLPVLAPMATKLLSAGAALPAAAVVGMLLAGKARKEEIEADPTAPGLENNPYAQVLRGEAKSLAQAGKMNTREALKVLQPGTAKQYLEAGPDASGRYLDGYSKEQLEQMAAGKYTGGNVVRSPVAPIAKQVETPREVQASALEQNTNRSNEIAMQKAEGTSSAPSATVVNNTNVSNTTNTTRITPPVRNQEISYNERLRSTFV